MMLRTTPKPTPRSARSWRLALACFAVVAFVAPGATAKAPSKKAKAAAKKKPAPKPLPTNAFPKLTDGLWSATLQGGGGSQAAIYFSGDAMSFTDAFQTFYGHFNSGKVMHRKDGVEMAAYGAATMRAMHGKSVEVDAKGWAYRMHIKIAADGRTANFCATPPGGTKVATPTSFLATAKDDKQVRCYTMVKVQAATVAPPPSTKSAPKRKNKMRTRGLDWSLGR